jgi:hypothetical protein
LLRVLGSICLPYFIIQHRQFSPKFLLHLIFVCVIVRLL